MMNIDFMDERLMIPTALFILLSPGLILSLPSTNIANMQTSRMSVAIHALVLVLLFWLLARSGLMKKNITKADLIVPALLFVLLSPMGTTSPMRIGVGAAIFFIVYAILRAAFPQVY